MFGDIGKMMKQAKELQENMNKMQSQLEDLKVKGEAAAGMASVELNGKGLMTALTLDPSLIDDDIQVLEDLIIAAHNDAKEKLETAMAEKMQDVTNGMQIPPGLMPGT